MKTIKEFMEKVQGYFGGFTNDTVAEMFATELKYIRPSDYDQLFRQMAITLPASWKPDYKSLIEAIKACKIETMNEPGAARICPVCGTVNNSTGICPVCCYRPWVDGTPEEHRAWFNDWKSGKVPHFDLNSLVADLVAQRAVK